MIIAGAGPGVASAGYPRVITSIMLPLRKGRRERFEGLAMPDNSSSESGGTKRKRVRGSLSSVSTVLSKVISRFGLEQRMKEHAFMSLWVDVVDEPFNRLARPLFIDCEGNLVVSVKDSSVSQELSFQRGTLLKKLAPFARGVGLTITGMRFDLKHFREADDPDSLDKALLSHKQAEARFKKAIPTREQLLEAVLSEQDQNELEKLKVGLRNGELDGEYEKGTCDRIVRLYERELRLRVWREQQALPSCPRCGFVDSRLYGALALCRLCHVLNLIETKSSGGSDVFEDS